MDAVRTAATALRLSEPAAGRVAIGFTDLDGLLARIGLDYDSTDARDLAATIAAVLRGTVDVVLAGEQPDLLSCLPSWPEAPKLRRMPRLAAAAARARSEALRGSASMPSTAIAVPGPADALLGAETGGIAPRVLAGGRRRQAHPSRSRPPCRARDHRRSSARPHSQRRSGAHACEPAGASGHA